MVDRFLPAAVGGGETWGVVVAICLSRYRVAVASLSICLSDT